MLHFAVKRLLAEASWQLLVVVELPLAELAGEESCRWTGGEVLLQGGWCAFLWDTGHWCSASPGSDAALPQGQSERDPAPSSLWLEGLTLPLMLQLSPNLFLANSKYCSVPPGSGLRPLNCESTAPASPADGGPEAASHILGLFSSKGISPSNALT